MVKRILIWTLILFNLIAMNRANPKEHLTKEDQRTGGQQEMSSIDAEIHEEMTGAIETDEKAENEAHEEELNSVEDIDDEIFPGIEGEGDIDKTQEEESKDEAEIELRLSFAGDCTIGTDTNFGYSYSFTEQFEKQKRDYNYFFNGVQPIFASDDLTLVNLETTFTTAEVRAVKKFCFKGPPHYAKILKQGSIEMVNISNNHIYDYLKQGYKDTLVAIEEAGILYSGEGNTAYYIVKGVTIASIGYTGWDISIKKKVEKDIEEAKSKADILIVSFHWGQERNNYPNSTQKELGRFCIDQGADIVIGHHPHVIQGIERYKGRYIVYSLGNFCFGGNRNPTDKDSFIFQAQFIKKHGEIFQREGRVIPCRISSVTYRNDYQPVILTQEEGEKVLERIHTYSKELEFGIIPDDITTIDK